MPFANRRPPMGIADTAPITCPSPKQVVNGLGLSIQLSELHLLSETKGLKLPVLLKRECIFLPVLDPWILQVTCLPSRGWMFHGPTKALQ